MRAGAEAYGPAVAVPLPLDASACGALRLNRRTAEALSNIARHAGAHQADVVLRVGNALDDNGRTAMAQRVRRAFVKPSDGGSAGGGRLTGGAARP